MTTQVLNMKRGDTAPTFRAQLLDAATPVDLTTSTGVRLLIQGQTAKTLTVEPGADGWVHYIWQANDLTVASTYKGEVEVTWASGKVQTFPANGYFVLYVFDDLG